MQFIAYFGGPPSSLSFFDFGMGWSRWALMAKAFGCDSYGTELSQARIEHARAGGITVLTWEQIPEHRFDFINTEQVFEHLPQPLATLKHLVQALKPAGLLKIRVPTAGDIERRLGLMDWTAPKTSKNSLNPVAPLEHINFYRRTSLLTLAERAGMREVRIPLSVQYAYTAWTGRRRVGGNLRAPIRRNILKSENYILLSPAARPRAS